MSLNSIEDVVAYYDADVAGILSYLVDNPKLQQEYYDLTGYHNANSALPVTSLKHLPGRHDQQRHDPTKGAGGRISPVDKDYIEKKINSDNSYYGLGMSGYLESKFFDNYRTRWNESLNYIRNASEDISERTGIDREVVYNVLDSWSASSNNSPVSQQIQRIVSDEFDVPLSKWQKAKFEGGKPSDISDSDVRKVVKTVYEDTQQHLRSQGVEEVTLFRGIRFKGKHNYKTSDVAELDMNAAEPWSGSYWMGKDFARNKYKTARGTRSGIVVAAKIPASRILALPHTGFGVLAQDEVAVLGGDVGEVRVVDQVGGK